MLGDGAGVSIWFIATDDDQRTPFDHDEHGTQPAHRATPPGRRRPASVHLNDVLPHGFEHAQRSCGHATVASVCFLRLIHSDIGI